VDTLPDLLARARARDPDATGELVRRFQPRVTALAHQKLQQRGKDRHAVLQLLSTGDVVQDVLIEVLRGLDRWEGDGEEPFTALLATLVEHRLVDQVRRAQAGRRDVRRRAEGGPETVGVAADQRSPATIAMNQEQLQIYRDVLGTFTDRERVLLTLRLEEGVEFAQLAATLAYPSADAARKAYHAVQARLLLRLRQRGLDLGGQTV
jgi:RNA polymerase sigma factor (sigma-70 family)